MYGCNDATPLYACIQIEKIKLPSEKNDNPIDEILFYKKPKSGNNDIELLTKREVQEMV
jgi:hypothetical protein